jgi:large subunit ribosomal protein L23
MFEQEVFAVIVRPLLTERSTIMKEKYDQYVFKTTIKADKGQIKHAIEELFKVRVKKVRTMVMPGKFHRYGRGGGFRSDWKKAIVTLEKGQKIDFAEQAA